MSGPIVLPKSDEIAARIRACREELAALWSVIVGDSGTLKSPAYLKAVEHLFAVQREKLLQFQDELKKYRKKKDTSADEEDAAGDLDEPVLRRVVCSDTTIEKLTEMLEDSPRGLLVARAELAGWLGSFTRYKGKAGGSDLPHWLEMYRAGPIIYDRKNGERRNVFVPRAAVSVTGGIQPGVLVRAFSADFIESGGAARLLMAMPPKRAKQWSEVEIHPDVEKASQRRKGVRNLFSLIRSVKGSRHLFSAFWNRRLLGTVYSVLRTQNSNPLPFPHVFPPFFPCIRPRPSRTLNKGWEWRRTSVPTSTKTTRPPPLTHRRGPGAVVSVHPIARTTPHGDVGHGQEPRRFH